MKLRRFNTAGIAAFAEFLESARRNPENSLPPGLLKSAKLTEVVSPTVQVAEEHFVYKSEAAIYLNQVLSPLAEEDLMADAGLWTWLTALYFDSVCSQENGRDAVKNDYRYIYEPQNMRHFYRHLLFVSWRVKQLAPVHNRLFLSSRIDTLDKITTEVMKRLYLTRIPCVFEVLDRLYWDETKKRSRPGITGSKVTAGDLTHRFPLRIRQLEKTYDLLSLSADQLIELLGEEFSFARPKKLQLFDA